MPRLFTALEIPHEAMLPLTLLRGGLPSARWTEAVNYHITLRFYGDISNQQADALVSGLDRLSFMPFSLRLKGIYVFSPKKPRTLYAGVEYSAPLTALQKKIEHSSHRVVPPETRKFTPHVSLAQLKEGQTSYLPRYLAEKGDFITPVFPVKRFCLMSSKESVGGGPYIIEESWALNKT